MAGTRQRPGPQKYPVELRERAVRMVFEVREQSGEKHGVITRVALELGVGSESLRGWVNQAEVDSGRRRRHVERRCAADRAARRGEPRVAPGQ